MKKILTLSLLLSLYGCINNKHYVAVCISKPEIISGIKLKVSDNHYIKPNININEWENINVGDTLIIEKNTLKLCYCK